MKSLRSIQARLMALGYYKGRIDGISGPKTRAAVRAFQRLHGLRVDGDPGPRTQAELFPQRIPERDIDPPAQQAPLANRWPRQKAVTAFYGNVGKNQTRVDLPFRMKLAWDKRVSVKRMTLHEKVADSASRVFERIAAHYSPEDIARHGFNLFGGSLNVRKMRGGSRYSMHSWGIAIDFDPVRNQLRWGRDRAYLARPECKAFVDFWYEEGWIGLGRERDYDHMHFQAARL